jgi:hypothetical protein
MNSLHHENTFLLAGVQDVTVEMDVPASRALLIKVRKVNQKGQIYKTAGTVHLGGKLFVSATITGLAGPVPEERQDLGGSDFLQSVSGNVASL